MFRYLTGFFKSLFWALVRPKLNTSRRPWTFFQRLAHFVWICSLTFSLSFIGVGNLIVSSVECVIPWLASQNEFLKANEYAVTISMTCIWLLFFVWSATSLIYCAPTLVNNVIQSEIIGQQGNENIKICSRLSFMVPVFLVLSFTGDFWIRFASWLVFCTYYFRAFFRYEPFALVRWVRTKSRIVTTVSPGDETAEEAGFSA